MGRLPQFLSSCCKTLKPKQMVVEFPGSLPIPQRFLIQQISLKFQNILMCRLSSKNFHNRRGQACPVHLQKYPCQCLPLLIFLMLEYFNVWSEILQAFLSRCWLASLIFPKFFGVSKTMDDLQKIRCAAQERCSQHTLPQSALFVMLAHGPNHGEFIG